MRSAIAVAIVLLMAVVAHAGSPRIMTYGEGFNDLASDALPLDDGGMIIVGETVVALEPEIIRHMLLLRLDAYGHLLWTRTYGGDRSSRGHGVSACGADGFIVSGAIQSVDSDDFDVYLLRVDSDGDELWSRTFGTPLNEVGGRIIGSESTGFWIVGNSVDPNDVVADPSAAGYAGFAGRSSIYVVRTDGRGRELWSRRMESEANTIAFGSAASDDAIVILSAVLHYPANDNDILLTKLSIDGDAIWSKTWMMGNALGYSITSATGGGYLISGLRSLSGGSAPMKSDALLVKVDMHGNEEWLVTYGEADQVEAADTVTETTDGGFVCCGWQTPDLHTPGDDILIAAFDRSGVLQWEELLPSSAHNLHARIFQHSDGSLVIVGSSRQPGQPFRIQRIEVDPPDRNKT